MDLPIIIFIVLYALVLCCYFITRVGKNIKYRAINKYIMATMYLILAFVGFSLRHEVSSYHIILIGALVLAWLGDIFLVFDLGRGGDFFMAANICFFIYGISVLYDNSYTFSFFWWVLLITFVMLTTFIILYQKITKGIHFTGDALADDLVPSNHFYAWIDGDCTHYFTPRNKLYVTWNWISVFYGF